ncbi:nucleotidyltransferase [Bradyrhizobium sp. RT3a]|uniref:nucleotidyltransferase domain-containing protein n=1 Tax=unclassified Bradyrhizobium TaxID=2631580 RepID=UPI003394FF6F
MNAANNQYLSSLLAGQNLTQAELDSLRSLRAKIEGQLAVLQGSPRFYYGGSFGKRTMIKARYDLDLVMYWPHTATYSITGIYDAVGETLKKHWTAVNSKTVAWELPFQGGFHIDVVPGRALDAQYYEANLHRTNTGTTLKTSLKKHIDTVRGSGRADAIRLMKLWKVRKGVPFKKSFLLELMTIEGCKGKQSDDLEGQIIASLKYVRDNIKTCSVGDPANSNNSLSDDLDATARTAIYQRADEAIKATYWSQVF